MPLSLPDRFPAAISPLESTDGIHSFLWLNVSVDARTANACDLSKQFDVQARRQDATSQTFTHL